jgi:hypothetical protein
MLGVPYENTKAKREMKRRATYAKRNASLPESNGSGPVGPAIFVGWSFPVSPPLFHDTFADAAVYRLRHNNL